MNNKSQQLIVSGKTLKKLAALLWYIGSIILLLKGGSLLSEAELLRPEDAWPWQV